MPWLKSGLMLCLSLALLASASCRSSKPPAIDVCIGDGAGGADCVLREGSALRFKCVREQRGWYCPPSALENAWITTGDDMEAYSSWCYDTSRKNVRPAMRAIRQGLGR